MVFGRVSSTGVRTLAGCGAEGRSCNNEEIWSEVGAESRGGFTGGWALSAVIVVAAGPFTGLGASEAAMVELT